MDACCARPFPYPKLLGPVAFGQSDLEDLHAAQVSSEPRQALLASAPNSNQEGMALRDPKDAADAAPGERTSHETNVLDGSSVWR